MSIILSMIDQNFEHCSKHNERNFEHNRPGPDPIITGKRGHKCESECYCLKAMVTRSEVHEFNSSIEQFFVLANYQGIFLYSLIVVTWLATLLGTEECFPGKTQLLRGMGFWLARDTEMPGSISEASTSQHNESQGFKYITKIMVETKLASDSIKGNTSLMEQTIYTYRWLLKRQH